MAGAQHLPDPALVAAEDRQVARDLVGEAGPGRDLEPVVAEDPDRRASARSARFVSSTIVRNSVLRGRVTRPGARRCRGRCRGARRARPRRRATLVARPTGSAATAARSAPAQRRRNSDGRAGRGSRTTDGPGPPGPRSSLSGARAHVPMVAPRGRPGGRHRSRSRPRTLVPSTPGSLTVRTAGLHSAGVAGPPRPRPSDPASEVSTPRGRRSQSHRAPPSASSPGNRSAPLPDG